MYTSVISALGKKGDYEAAWTLYQEVQGLGSPMTATTTSAATEEPNSTPISRPVTDKILVFTMLKLLEEARMWERAALVRQNSGGSGSGAGKSRGSAADATAAAADGFSSLPFSDLIREGRRTGDFRAAVRAADQWLRDDR
jgi:pentatricopeptide repeat protein